MNKFEILSVTLEYIEENLTGEISPEICAAKCGYSLSNLQKMFRCAFHIGVSDYISRRRLTRAAKDLLETEQTVLDIALKYGYNSHEVFTRAFVRLWGMTPSRFRKNCTFSEIFPKFSGSGCVRISVTDNEGKVFMEDKIVFDVSHLYDYIREHAGKYAICFDMVRLMYVNETYGSTAGDAALAECLRRIAAGADDTMLPMRIGGDEFILITDFSELSHAEEAAAAILSHNEETVTSGGHTIPVSMRAGYVKIPDGNLRYNELFTSFVTAGHADAE